MTLGGILELGVVIAGLRNAVFGERTHLLGDDLGEWIVGICHDVYPSQWVN